MKFTTIVGKCTVPARISGQPLHRALAKANVAIQLDEALDSLPFEVVVPVPDTVCVVLSEAVLLERTASELVARLSCVVTAHRCDSRQVVVFCKYGRLTHRFLEQLQPPLTIERGMTVLPVTSMDEVARYVNFTMNGTKTRTVVVKAKPLDEAVLAAFESLPNVGTKKARLLLGAFKSIARLAGATADEITANVPSINAEHARIIYATLNGSS